MKSLQEIYALTDDMDSRLDRAYSREQMDMAKEQLKRDPRAYRFLSKNYEEFLVRKSPLEFSVTAYRLCTLSIAFDYAVDPDPHEGISSVNEFLDTLVLSHNEFEVSEEVAAEAIRAVREHAERLKCYSGKITLQ